MKKHLLILSLAVLVLFGALSAARAAGLAERLSGWILLQVEAHGEAWYVNPANQERYFLGHPADAFRIMRELGLGITNRDFDSYNGIAPARLKGKIIIKVEDLGKAYYINPADLALRYLGRPSDAFAVMRELGLGITNASLESIPVAAGYGVPETPPEPEPEPEPGEPVVCPEPACEGSVYRQYELGDDNSCVAIEDDCSDCSCSCGGYDQAENTDNDNCGDGADNDCNGLLDGEEASCQITGTEVSGSITANTVWTTDGSPYRVTDTLTVNAGAVLKINAGVIVNFATASGIEDLGGVSMIVNGGLEANGTLSLPVTITSSQATSSPGDWGAIEVVNGGSLTMSHVRLSGATTGIRAANARSLNITSSEISDCRTAIYASGPATISGNSLNNNYTGVVYSGTIASPRDNGTYANFDRIATVVHNTISHNRGGDPDTDGGIIIYGVTVGGFRLDFEFNDLNDNTNGIIFRDSDYYDHITIEQNNITDSQYYNVLVKSQGASPAVEDNWWGTDNLDELDAKVFDYFDVNYALPQVDYKPFLYAPVFGAGAAG